MISETPMSSDLFKQSMRLLAGGVCIVATSDNGEWHGLTMTAVCSLTTDPPSLIACVNRGAGTRGIISVTRRVSVNILSDDHSGLAERFGSPAVRGPDRFDAHDWTELASGVPALVDALAVLDCEVIRETELGQHCVFFCEVKNSRLQPDRKPLVHFNREFCAVQPV
ncbi:flavin reductase family protein [Rhodopseudomonas palustris]|uniref:flavin reductase family protein n=1 Tax=Rhodopseudomonas palustris TaxID=1076 RepID=UPI002ACE6845|nr:flavin reductase family protein [Rhodopseudomonas palustris]WQG99811.1 flavin reductase family protein [Rhodopseudomonas palustris]